jgi:hypothetical protein
VRRVDFEHFGLLQLFLFDGLLVLLLLEDDFLHRLEELCLLAAQQVGLVIEVVEVLEPLLELSFFFLPPLLLLDLVLFSPLALEVAFEDHLFSFQRLLFRVDQLLQRVHASINPGEY